MKFILFVCFLIFSIVAISYGENLPVNPDTFSQWFSGKLVLGSLAGMFLSAFILLLFEKKEKKKLPMATPKYKYLRKGR